MVKKIICRLFNKKGQVSLEESPEEKFFSICLLILFIVLIIVFCYLVYHYLIKDRQLIELLGKIFRGY
jgi:uncharacterized protein (UPF0333 family)